MDDHKFMIMKFPGQINQETITPLNLKSLQSKE